MHSSLLLPRKLEYKIIPLKAFIPSNACLIPFSTEVELMRKSYTLMRYNVALNPLPSHSKKTVSHNWERKCDVLGENSGKQKISTTIAHYPTLPAWNSTMTKLVVFAMSPWRMCLPVWHSVWEKCTGRLILHIMRGWVRGCWSTVYHCWVSQRTKLWYSEQS